ncbi:MAG: hypothetical protein AB7V50_04530 [Vampirovibrionia bacterium]
MKNFNVRKIHRSCAVVMSPFLLLSVLTATTLILDHLKVVSLLEQQEKIIFKVHTWGIIAPYFGLFIALGLFIVIITGLMMFKR